DGYECSALPERAKRVWEFCQLHLAVCRWQADSDGTENARGLPALHATIRHDQQGSEEARVPFRGNDHLLRLHAVGRARERPPGYLFQISGISAIAALERLVWMCGGMDVWRYGSLAPEGRQIWAASSFHTSIRGPSGLDIRQQRPHASSESGNVAKLS